MTVEVDFWRLVGFGITLLSGFAGVIFTAGKLFAAQFERRLNERFDSIRSAHDREMRGISRVERDFMAFKAELPVQYVRREDYVRGQSIVEAKLDGLASKLDNAQLRAQLNTRPHVAT